MDVLIIVVPVLLMMVIGKIAGVTGIIDDQSVAGIKGLIANVMLPVTLFNALASTVFDGRSMILVAGIYVAFCLILGIAMKCRPFFKPYEDYAPFLCVSFEGGMLCYALYMTIFGSESLSTLLKIDLANMLFAFSIFLFSIKAVGTANVDRKAILKDFLKSPVVIGIIAGLICSLTGLGQMLPQASFYPLYSAVVTMITAPLSALVLITVGYGMSFDSSIMASVLKVSFARLVLNVLALLAIIAVFRPFLAEKALLVGLILEFFMPGQFITPIYITDEAQQRFASTQLSCYTILSIVAYIIIITVI